MEKKKYYKPQINVIAIDAVGIMAVSTETIPIGRPGSGNDPEPDEDGFIYGEQSATQSCGMNVARQQYMGVCHLIL